MPSQSGNAAEAGCDLTRTNHPALWLITWDPTQPIATRPLAIQKDGTWYTYGLDLTKNVCEVFGATGYIRTAYTYSPYGSVKPKHQRCDGRLRNRLVIKMDSAAPCFSQCIIMLRVNK